MAATARPPVDHIHLVGQQTSSRGRESSNAELVTGKHPGTITVSLTQLVVETARAVATIEDVLRRQFEGHPTSGSDLTMALSVDFTPTDSGDDGMPDGIPWNRAAESAGP